MVEENENLQSAAEAMIRLANKKGGLDNITAVVFSKN